MEPVLQEVLQKQEKDDQAKRGELLEKIATPGGGAGVGRQVKKNAIRMRMMATVAEPYFTSLMKPS
jgi:hypothetical protein